MASSRVLARMATFSLPVFSADQLEGGHEGAVLAEGVPAQVAFLHELLDVLGRRAAGAGLEEPAALHERDDGEHPGAGAELEDREEIGEVVTEDVAGDRDGVLAAADALEGEPHGVDGLHDADVETAGVVVREVLLDLLDDLGVVATLRVEPEDRRRSGGAGPGHRELDPVLDRRILDLAHAEDVARLDRLLEEGGAGGVDHPEGAVGRVP